eukprot:scaffold22737_cov32-Tisochrysis_lutea.AAC.1
MRQTARVHVKGPWGPRAPLPLSPSQTPPRWASTPTFRQGLRNQHNSQDSQGSGGARRVRHTHLPAMGPHRTDPPPGHT